MAPMACLVRGKRLGRCSFHTGDTVMDTEVGSEASLTRTDTSDPESPVLLADWGWWGSAPADIACHAP